MATAILYKLDGEFIRRVAFPPWSKDTRFPSSRRFLDEGKNKTQLVFAAFKNCHQLMHPVMKPFPCGMTCLGRRGLYEVPKH